jgi:lactosylceramide 4-alpha-galactosyltransferase
MMENFSGTNRIQNGPLVLTRVLAKICNTNETAEMNIERCNGFNPLERNQSYPISWGDYSLFLEEKYLQNVMDAIKDAYMVHTWNSQISEKPLAVNSKAPYIVLAKQYCPIVMNTIQDDFV